jgi:DNA-binding response OmpR family regulator
MAGDGLEAMDSGWRELWSRLRAEARVLVVDDEESARSVLEQVLSGEGYTVDALSDAESAWAELCARSYDLAVVDKNLEGVSGVDLVGRMREAGMDVPVVLVTGYPSLSTISEALGAGAADYIAKPFPDISRLVLRLESVIELRLAERLYQRVTEDLSRAVKAQGTDGPVLERISQSLFDFKDALARRPSSLVIESSAGLAEVAQDALAASGIAAEVVTDLDEATRRLSDREAGPLTVVVSLAVPGAVPFIQARREADPLLEVVATGARTPVETVLDAIDAGAADFFMRSAESLDALQARVRRAVTRSRRQRLYLHLVETLWRTARQNDQRVDGLLAALPPSHRRLVVPEETAVAPGAAIPESEPIEVAVDDLYDPNAEQPPAPVAPNDAAEKTGVERRKEPRYPYRGLVHLRPWGTGAAHMPCQMRDISVSGMFVHLPSPPPLGTRFEILIPGPQEGPETPIQAVAEVVRSVKVEPDPGGQSGVGLRVVGADPGLERLAGQVAAERSPSSPAAP